MFRIGEFSKLTQVSIRMLRYYDEVGLLKPARVDHESGYRFYSADQIPQLSRIVFLRDLGFAVSEIRKALQDWHEGAIDLLLSTRHREIEASIEREQAQLQMIERAKRDLKQNSIELCTSVSIRSIPAYQVLSYRKIVPDYYAEGALWEEMSAFVRKEGIPLSEDTLTIYHDTDYREEDVDIELCMPAKPIPISSFPEGFGFRSIDAVPFMACTMVYGPFENISGAYHSFANWLQGHTQYEMVGQSRQIVHRGPWNESEAEKYVTEIQIPLRKKSEDIGFDAH